jgi:hypothetical protein
MTVNELVELLEPEKRGSLPVRVRCQWHGEAPAHAEFDIAYAAEVIEPDTGEDVILLECRQDG